MNIAEHILVKGSYVLALAFLTAAGITLFAVFNEATWWGKVFNLTISIVALYVAAYLAGRGLFHLGGRINV